MGAMALPALPALPWGTQIQTVIESWDNGTEYPFFPPYSEEEASVLGDKRSLYPVGPGNRHMSPLNIDPEFGLYFDSRNGATWRAVKLWREPAVSKVVGSFFLFHSIGKGR
jgi:hypothetical protein